MLRGSEQQCSGEVDPRHDCKDTFVVVMGVLNLHYGFGQPVGMDYR